MPNQGSTAYHGPGTNSALGHHVGADAHQGPLANPHPAAQVHPGRDVRVILNSAVMIDCAAGVKDHIGPYHAARIDHDTGTDRGPRANLDPGSNNRAGMARGDKALAFLLKEACDIRSHLLYSGLVLRAENRALLKLLTPAWEHNDVLDELDHYSAVALVDTQPGAGNNRLPNQYIPKISK